jgi:hypothetical protein
MVQTKRLVKLNLAGRTWQVEEKSLIMTSRKLLVIIPRKETNIAHWDDDKYGSTSFVK